MKHLLRICLALSLLVLTACGPETAPPVPDKPVPSQTEPEPVPQPEQETGFSYADLEGFEFSFSSGAGAWSTGLRIREDGHFEGMYIDSDMGDMSDAYPNGTQYASAFSGQFTQPEMVNDYTARTEIAEISYEVDPGTEDIRDGVRHIYTEAHGLINAEEILIYLPDAPLAQLPEEFLQWVHLWNEEYGDKTLESYGLYNVTEQLGFIAFDPLPVARMQVEYILEEAEKLDAELTEKAENNSEMTQADLNQNAADRFGNWDQSLNAIWAVLNGVLPQEEMDRLTQEELDWIDKKEAAVEKAGLEVEGGSLYPSVTFDEAARWTKSRAYVLASYLEGEN